MKENPKRHFDDAGPGRAPDVRAGCSPVVLVVLALVVLGVGCTTPSISPERSLSDFGAHLNERVPQLLDRYDIPGVSMTIVRDGELAWSNAYGTADREQGRPMTVDAVFRIESLSKPVTAWGIMRLVEDGRVDLDAPVHRYLDDWTFPDTKYPEEEVTARQLLSHTAGFPLGPIGEGMEYAPHSDHLSVRDYLAREAQLIRRPGSGFSYSNVGYNLLELLIEEVSGRDFATYMEEEVLNPLGMRRSTFAWRDSLFEDLPMGYEGDGTPVAPYVYPVQAAGGLLAPVKDIAQFLRAEIEIQSSGDAMDGSLSRESIRTLHAPQTDISGLYGIVADGYGLGHFVEVLPDDQRAVWHGGQGHGWMSHFHLVPESGDGIVLLTNSERSWPLFADVLTTWSRWRGYGEVKIGRIADATTALRGIVGLVLVVSLLLLYRLVRGLRSGRRRWTPLSSTSWATRLLQATLGLGAIAGLAWSAAQPYLKVASIFPAMIGWVGGALFVWAVVMVLSASCPRREG